MRLFIILFLCSVTAVSSAQQFGFVNTYHHEYSRGFLCAADEQGHVFLSGNFIDSIDLDPGPAEFWVLMPDHEPGFFIASYTTEGTLQWAKTISGGSVCESKHIYLDPQGFILMTGIFLGVVDFDPSTGVKNLDSDGKKHAFILKLDLDGNLVWADNFEGGAGSSTGQVIVTDAMGNIYIGGNYFDFVDFNPGIGNATLQSPVGTDAYLVKLNSAGAFGWAESLGWSGTATVLHILPDEAGNVYALGCFNGVLDFDEGTQIPSHGADDIFLGKHPVAGGAWDWVHTYGGAGDELAGSIVAGKMPGEILVAGTFSGTTDFNPKGPSYTLTASDKDGFLMQVLADGSLGWVKQLNGTSKASIKAMAREIPGTLIFIGVFSGSIFFDLGQPLITELQTNSSLAFFIARADLDGHFQDAFKIGEGNGFNFVESYKGFAYIPSGTIYATGGFWDHGHFELGSTYYQVAPEDFTSHFFYKIEGVSTQVTEIRNSAPIVYPNPGNGMLYLQTDGDCCDLQIFGMDGTSLATYQDLCQQVDLSFLPKGIYFLSIKHKALTKLLKWVRL